MRQLLVRKLCRIGSRSSNGLGVPTRVIDMWISRGFQSVLFAVLRLRRFDVTNIRWFGGIRCTRCDHGV
ncbi:MAG: hypothetical protein JWO62_3685 [Acidimicrobiaceae bacterium]|nr:hypothetical protein [Acidimicrobiaceae bacterium]